jgi:orotate phosphoribosyltransferase
MDTSQKIAKILLKIKAVTLNVKRPYTYSSGIKSPIYCDNRLLMAYPRYRQKVRDAFIGLINANNLEFDIVGGTATAGIPHAAWLACALQKPMVYIRSKTKGYGKNKLIEGKLLKGEKVLIIEDLISTGASALSAAGSLRQEGGIAQDCIAIFTYGLLSAKENFKQADINLYTITNLTALLDAAIEEGYISDDEAVGVLEWSRCPEDWGKN